MCGGKGILEVQGVCFRGLTHGDGDLQITEAERRRTVDGSSNVSRFPISTSACAKRGPPSDFPGARDWGLLRRARPCWCWWLSQSTPEEVVCSLLLCLLSVVLIAEGRILRCARKPWGFYCVCCSQGFSPWLPSVFVFFLVVFCAFDGLCESLSACSTYRILQDQRMVLLRFPPA